MAHAGVSNFRVEFEILVKRIRVEDTEAYQKMIRMKYEPFCEIFTAILVIWPFTISIWARLWQSWWPKKPIIPYILLVQKTKNYYQLSRQIWRCPKYMIADDGWW